MSSGPTFFLNVALREEGVEGRHGTCIGEGRNDNSMIILPTNINRVGTSTDLSIVYHVGP